MENNEPVTIEPGETAILGLTDLFGGVLSKFVGESIDDSTKEAIRTSFFDDSSTALNLDHQAEGQPTQTGGIADFFAPLVAEHKRLLKIEMERQGLTDPSHLVTSNGAAYRDIEARTRELQSEGMVLLEAVRQARQEAAEGWETPVRAEITKAKLRDYLGDRVANLMRPGVEPAKGGGGARGRKGRQPKPKFYCDECHTEFCIHRPSDGSAGRKTIERVAQLLNYGVRLTEDTLNTLKKHGETPAEALRQRAKQLEGAS